MRLAVIPARGGSKRIPRKNVKVFCGKPIMVWSIEAAQNSGCFDRILVSTDDEEIADLARDSGAEVPFMRPAALSDDMTPTLPVIQHAIDWQTGQGDPPALTCCIYATAPFLTGDCLQRGLDVLLSSGASYAFSVTSYAFPIQRALRLTHEGRVEMFSPDQFNTRSQDLAPAYHDAGQFYWGQSDAWRRGESIFSHSAAPVILSRHEVQDIDTLEDWQQAEALFRVLRGYT